MKDLAVAISVYDKFQDVKLLTDLFRRNWPGNYHIVVCASHPNPAPHLADCDIDELLVIDDLPLPSGWEPPDPRVAPRARLWVRVLDSFRKACGRCAESQAPVTLNLQADACPLSWPKLKGLIDKMKRGGKRFAARGEGFGFYSFNEPLGGFDDMFCIIDNAYARSVGLWDFTPFDFMPHKISIHGVIAILGLTRIGVRRFYHYADHTQAVYWDGKPVVLHPLNSVHPMHFDPQFDFLHIHETGFSGDVGSRLKAHYLGKYGIVKGVAVEEFLHTWWTPQERLFEQLAEMEADLRRFFTSKGLSPAAYGRNFDRMEAMRNQYRQSGFSRRLAWLTTMHIQQLKDLASGFVRKRYMQGRIYRSRYSDMVWPDSLDELYESIYSEIPRELRDVSFDAEGSSLQEITPASLETRDTIADTLPCPR